MEMLFKICTLVLGISALVYSIIIIRFSLGWKRTKEFISTDNNQKTFVSVIIPFRNEADHLASILIDIKKQSYPEDLTEFIFIDDHSEDNGIAILTEKTKGLKTVKIIELKDGLGKKAALITGINMAVGSLIITTDADCRFGNEWVKTITEFYEKNHPKLIVGPVIYMHEKSAFQKIQSLDFLSLIASGAGSTGAGSPIMCNGANLAFEKSAFLVVNAYSKNDVYASGDDQFLLFNIQKHFGTGSVKLLKSTSAVVTTRGVKSLMDFFSQRIRWGSKGKAYKSSLALLTAISVFIFNLSMLFFFAIALFFPYWIVPATLAFTIKLIVDFWLLNNFSRYFNKQKLMWWYFPTQLLYPIYISIAGILSVFSINKWKGRRIK